MTIGTRDRLVVLLLLAAVDDDDDDKRNDEDGKDNVVVALNDDRLVVVDGINATDNAAAGNRIARKIMNKLHLRLLFSPRRGEARFLAGNAASKNSSSKIYVLQPTVITTSYGISNSQQHSVHRRR